MVFLSSSALLFLGCFFHVRVQTSSCQIFKSNNHHVQVWALNLKIDYNKRRGSILDPTILGTFTRVQIVCFYQVPSSKLDLKLCVAGPFTHKLTCILMNHNYEYLKSQWMSANPFPIICNCFSGNECLFWKEAKWIHIRRRNLGTLHSILYIPFESLGLKVIKASVVAFKAFL